jgi:hypothetical protein
MYITTVFQKTRSKPSSHDRGKIGPALRGQESLLEQTSAGRYLRVIYVTEVDGVFVITAYELTGKPLLAYRRRKRRKR